MMTTGLPAVFLFIFYHDDRILRGEAFQIPVFCFWLHGFWLSLCLSLPSQLPAFAHLQPCPCLPFHFIDGIPIDRKFLFGICSHPPGLNDAHPKTNICMLRHGPSWLEEPRTTIMLQIEVWVSPGSHVCRI